MCLKDLSLSKNESTDNSDKNDSVILSEETSEYIVSDIITEDDEDAYANVNRDVFRTKIDEDKVKKF